MVGAFYAAKLMEDGKWWVGFRYSDGRFDPIAAHESMDDALRASHRMNGSSYCSETPPPHPSK